MPWPVEAAERYADIRYFLQSSGRPIGERDMMIAAHALALGATLVTNNRRHFERIDGLALADWTND